mmetsp:Transcript_16431/g.35692  ORF Transcript_16431/g.35692 Transcript_16431/m.35692 type:complete len:94 (+) Transcript_16431:265-546(+)
MVAEIRAQIHTSSACMCARAAETRVPQVETQRFPFEREPKQPAQDFNSYTAEPRGEDAKGTKNLVHFLTDVIHSARFGWMGAQSRTIYGAESG